MGKKILVQRRGRGTSVFRSRPHKRVAPAKYPRQMTDGMSGIVEELLHEAGRGAPLAHVRLENGESHYLIAVDGLHVGQRVECGRGIAPERGNIGALGDIPTGTAVCNVELRAGDGGKLVRSSGTYATVVAHGPTKTSLRLPSKRSIEVGNDCRATIGIAGGGGRLDKPFLKAGEKRSKKRAKGQKYPTVKGISMIAASHPHGGGRHRRSLKPTSVSRTAPPGQKVGLIAPKWAGRKKKERG